MIKFNSAISLRADSTA